MLGRMAPTQRDYRSSTAASSVCVTERALVAVRRSVGKRQRWIEASEAGLDRRRTLTIFKPRVLSASFLSSDSGMRFLHLAVTFDQAKKGRPNQITRTTSTLL